MDDVDKIAQAAELLKDGRLSAITEANPEVFEKAFGVVFGAIGEMLKTDEGQAAFRDAIAKEAGKADTNCQASPNAIEVPQTQKKQEFRLDPNPDGSYSL